MITEIGREPTHHPRSPPVVAVLRCVWTMASSRAPRHSLTGGGRATKGRRRAHLHILGGGGILRRIEAGGEHISGGGGIAVDSCSTHRVSNNPLHSIHDTPSEFVHLCPQLLPVCWAWHTNPLPTLLSSLHRSHGTVLSPPSGLYPSSMACSIPTLILVFTPHRLWASWGCRWR